MEVALNQAAPEQLLAGAGHPGQEAGGGATKGSRPAPAGGAEADDDALRRPADPATSPTSSSTPKAPWSRAVIRSIMAIARRCPSAPRSASRRIQAISGRLNRVSKASFGNAPTITARPRAT